jgi:hypothetical protein
MQNQQNQSKNSLMNNAIVILKKHPYLIIGVVAASLFETAILLVQKENVVILSIIAALTLITFALIQLFSDRQNGKQLR